MSVRIEIPSEADARLIIRALAITAHARNVSLDDATRTRARRLSDDIAVAVRTAQGRRRGRIGRSAA